MFCKLGKSSAIKLMGKVDFYVIYLPEGSEKARTSEPPVSKIFEISRNALVP